MALILAFLLGFSPLSAGLVSAQTTSTLKAATEAETSLLNRLAKNGFLGEKKSHYLKAKALTGEEVVEALAEIDRNLSSLQGSGTQPGASYTEEDLKGLLDLVKGRKDALWDKKVQVWSFEKKVKDMIGSFGKLAASTKPAEDKAETQEKPAPKAVAEKPEEKPAPAPTPVPEVTQEELDEVGDQAKELAKKLNDLSADTEKRLEKSRKEAEETQRVAGENLEQLKILKKLVDQVQANLDKTGTRLEEVAQKAAKKTLADDELRQELTVLHKDMRDNSQDISVLKQEMAKLEQKKAPKGRSPLDEALTSPWVAGGALIVGLAALIVSVTK